MVHGAGIIDKLEFDEVTEMIDYGLKDKVAIITGANNPWGIGATTALALAREGAKVVLVYKKILREFDEIKTNQNGADRYFKANAGGADDVENKLKAMGADYLILESDISCEDDVKEIYAKVLEKYKRVDILINRQIIHHFPFRVVPPSPLIEVPTHIDNMHP